MKAKFKSTCSECGALIKAGSEISKRPSGKWIHKHCSSEPEELP